MFIHYGPMEPKEGYYTINEYRVQHPTTTQDDEYIQDHIDRHCPPKGVKGIYCFPMLRYSIDWMYVWAYMDYADTDSKWKMKRGEYRNECYNEINECDIKTIYSKIEKDGTFSNKWKKYTDIIEYLSALFNRIDMHIKDENIAEDDYVERINVCKRFNDSNALEVFIELK